MVPLLGFMFRSFYFIIRNSTDYIVSIVTFYLCSNNHDPLNEFHDHNTSKFHLFSSLYLFRSLYNPVLLYCPCLCLQELETNTVPTDTDRSLRIRV